MGFTSLKIYVILGALLLGVVTYVGFLHKHIGALSIELAQAEHKNETLSETIRFMSTSQQDMVTKVDAATKQREQIQQKLSATQRKLRQQVPPTECKEAIEWAVDNVGDLNW